MNTTLEKVKTEELSLVSAMADTIWQQHYPPIIGQAQTDYMLTTMYNVVALTNNIREKGETYYWIIEEAERVGFLAIAPKEEGMLSLQKIYILTEHQHLRIGSSVFGILEDLYPWFSSLWLTVNRKNIAAINFYFKNGFIIDHAEDFDIGEGYLMEDFVMKRKFAQKTE